MFALFAGAGLVFVTHVAKGRIGLWDYNQSQDKIVNAFTGDSVENAILAWGFIMIVLFPMSEFPSTAPLAAAFAWLIFISVILVNADVLMKIAGNTPALGGSGSASQTSTGGGPRQMLS
jgi:hypothetical protein